MGFHDPNVETLSREDIDRLQRRKLEEMLSALLSSNAFYTRKLAGVKFDPRTDSMQQLPVTTRQELETDQLEHPPYGSNLTFPPDQYIRLHQTSASSGSAPLRWLDTAESWKWFRYCWQVLYRAAGVESGDRFFFPFSFGPFIGFWSAFEAAAELGCLTIAGGGMTTSARLRMILDHSITVVCCTPTYALRMAEVAKTDEIDLTRSAVRALVVAGEPGGSIPTTRAQIEAAWGARVLDHTGMTEIGSCSFECLDSPGAVHIIESEFIAEVVNPDSGTAVADGEIGELILTNLGRLGSPLIRYRTGDQVRLARGPCACGRWFARLEGGILGRTDDMLLVRGNNIFPSALEEVIRTFPVAEFRLVTVGKPAQELRIEVEPQGGTQTGELTRNLAEAIRHRFLFRPTVVAVAPGALPRYEMKSRRVVFENQKVNQ